MYCPGRSQTSSKLGNNRNKSTNDRDRKITKEKVSVKVKFIATWDSFQIYFLAQKLVTELTVESNIH